MVSASSSRERSWNEKGPRPVSSTTELSVPWVAPWPVSSCWVIGAVPPEDVGAAGDAALTASSPGPAGASRGAAPRSLGRLLVVRALADGQRRRGGAQARRAVPVGVVLLAVAAGHPAGVRVRLEPDRLRGPRLTGAVLGLLLAPAGEERQRRQDQEDRQRDGAVDEHGLDHGHGRNLPGSARTGPVGHQRAGWQCAQGRASSSWADSEINVASSAGRPTSMVPTGRPDAVHHSGTLTAGCPVTL